MTHCPRHSINRSGSPAALSAQQQHPAQPQPSCHCRTMGLVLLAPLALALLALSCRAAPLQTKPQAVVTFPGELLSTLSDVELAEVRAGQPPRPPPTAPVPGMLPGPQHGAVS